MKKLLYLLVVAMFFTSCVSTGILEIVDNKKVIYNVDVESLPKSCEKNQIFTTITFSKDYYDPNYVIGNLIKGNLDRPVFLSTLPPGLKKKNTILVFDPNTYIVDFYKVQKTTIEKYSFKVDIDFKNLEYLAKLTKDFTSTVESYSYWKSRADDAAKPLIEKTRSVPYTAYRTVSKSRAVTKYRTVFTTYGSYQEPYTDYEWYTVTEPYTAYRLESYMAPNPNYNPTASIEYQETANKYFEEGVTLKEKIGNISYYKVWYND